MRTLVFAVALLAGATTGAVTLHTPVFEPLQSFGPPLNPENVTTPPIDRELKYPHDFRLDAPFSIALPSNESVLVPFDPIRSMLFDESDAPIAVGFELSTCEGRVLSTLVMHNDASHRLSTAPYQCSTLVKTPTTPPVDLCPIVHSDRDVAIHKDPTNVKGFVLRAEASGKVVVLLRSTKDRGAYNRAFFVDKDNDPPSARQLNVSFSAASTSVAFLSAREWQPTSSNATTCDNCQYTLYAEKLPSSNDSFTPQYHPPPYCVKRKDAISYTLPVDSASARQNLTLPSRFGDLFSSSGNYSFTLVVSIPPSANNGHPALFTYVPVRVSVVAPTHHFVVHILVVLGVIAALACLSLVAIKAGLLRLLVAAKPTTPSELSHEDESVRLLAQVIAEQDAHDALENEDEAHQSESLLDVIRKTKAKETTAQPPPGAQLDGYHEIN